MKRLSFALALLLAAFYLSPAAMAESLPETTGAVRVGDLAPPFTLETIDGKRDVCVGTKDCPNNVKVLVFWSFFCFPCQDEMPDLENFYRENIDNGVEVIAVGLDGHEYDNFVLPFVKRLGLTMPLTYDTPNQNFFEVSEKYGVVGTPTFFVVDPQNKIRFIQLGRIDPMVLGKIVEAARTQSFCADIVKAPRGGGGKPKADDSK
ncbi:TlpA family protein disulfide reductase [bacterium]|nr:MAG: TlpA family protein disulfide reductase [bacterium]